MSLCSPLKIFHWCSRKCATKICSFGLTVSGFLCYASQTISRFKIKLAPWTSVRSVRGATKAVHGSTLTTNAWSTAAHQFAKRWLWYIISTGTPRRRRATSSSVPSVATLHELSFRSTTAGPDPHEISLPHLLHTFCTSVRLPVDTLLIAARPHTPQRCLHFTESTRAISTQQAEIQRALGRWHQQAGNVHIWQFYWCGMIVWDQGYGKMMIVYCTHPHKRHDP